MLKKFRNSLHNNWVKLILSVVVLSFLVIGANSMIGGSNPSYIASFSDAEPISVETFQKAKAKEIDMLRQQDGFKFNNASIDELNINRLTLTKLVNDSMMQYLAKYYDFDLSDSLVLQAITKSAFFQNQNGEFDPKIFQNIFHNSHAKEQEYIESVKKQLVNVTLLDIFSESIHVPKAVTNNMLSYLSEERLIDLMSIDLSKQEKNYVPESIKDKDLVEFYNNNLDSFVSPEVRNFNYISANKELLLRNLKFSEEDLKKFFEENADDFPKGKYSELKKQIKEAFIKESLIGLAEEFAKNLEEDVTNGLNINEIAEKYGLEISTIENMSFDDMANSKKMELKVLADTVFEISTGDIAYPLILPDQNEILLVNLVNIKESAQQDFDSVKSKIKSN